MSIESTLPVRLAVPAAIFLAVVSTGCATNPDGTMALKFDDKVKGALIGSVAGCAIGSAVGGSCAKGAAVGALAGFLIGWYFESRKVASAQQVNREYASAPKQAGRIVPPKNDVVPARFTTKVSSGARDPAGEKEIRVTSNTDMIGYGDSVPNVQQKYALYDEKNNLVDEKTERLASVDGAGRYESQAKFKYPKDAKGKHYKLKTELVSNGKTYRQSSYKVAIDDDGEIIVLALAD